MPACCQDLLLSEDLRFCVNNYFSLSKWTPILAVPAHVSVGKMPCVSRCHLLLRSMQDVQGRIQRQTRKHCKLHQRFVNLKHFISPFLSETFLLNLQLSPPLIRDHFSKKPKVSKSNQYIWNLLYLYMEMMIVTDNSY